ncbi:MAG TPA: hypothetical protein P5519_09995 [Spirochaetia bacterium]|nr:hypothetical protein [Spirochaetia bacterium]
MKKMILMLMMAVSMIAASTAVKAQSSTTMSLAAGDTIVNTGTSAKIIQVTGSPSGIAITAVLAKLSGTNGGTVGIYGSPDGTNYDLIGSTYSITTATAQSKTFYITAPLPSYIKILGTGTGTMSTVLTVKYRTTYYQPK